MSAEPQVVSEEPRDATRGEMICYSMGSLAGSMCSATYTLLTPLLVMTLQISPLLVGLILSVRTLWDAFTDPIMASITDNADTRWGRRRPFILVGGVTMCLTCLVLWLFVPKGSHVVPNVEPVKIAAQAVPGETAPAKAPPPPRLSFSESMTQGWKLLMDPSQSGNATVWYMMIGLTLLATFQTIYGVPYYALGIELSPSYHGRTRVVAYRSVFDKIVGFMAPWFLPFCMMPYFVDGVDGAKYLMGLLLIVALPASVIVAVKSKERIKVDKARKKIGVLKSFFLTAKNIHFLKIVMLFVVIQTSLGVFSQLGLFLNIYYVFGGDKQAGTLLAGQLGSFGVAMALLSIPIITWICKKFEKHNALRFAIVLMSIGCALNWWCLVPGHPEYQFILPFFFSLGISSTYTVMGTLMADVTDVDELETGARREGMFGAVNAYMIKAVASIQALAAGAVLVATGFAVELGAEQAPGTFLKMRVLFSFAPAILLLLALVILYRYPLTAARMAEIKQILADRKAAAAAATAQA